MKIKFVLVVVSLCLVMGLSPVLADCPTQECKAGICAGDINLSGTVTIGDVSLLIDCVYNNNCTITSFIGDVDGDCDVDEDDVDYLVAYLFMNGPMPKCPYCLYIGDPPQGSDCPCFESTSVESIKSLMIKPKPDESEPVKPKPVK